jgi:hypothetical protein
MWNGRRIYLIDTPGFNDTDRSDIDTLSVLATYLSASYANGARIHGVVMLHPISDNRMSGSSLRNINMMKAMCGFESYANFAIATTMWPSKPDYAEKAVLESRNAQLLADDSFFGALVTRGATVFRHNQKGYRSVLNEGNSAKQIVAHLVRQSDMHTLDVLQLQRELVDQGKKLGETTAGIAVAGDLYKLGRAHEHHLRELETEMKSNLAKTDAAHAAALRELKAEVEEKLQKAEEDKEALKKSMDTMHDEEQRLWKNKIRKLDRLFRKQLKAKEQQLLDMEESLVEVRKDMARQAQTARQKELDALQNAEHEEIISAFQVEVSDAKTAYKTFRGQTDSILNGTLNGLSSGIASGLFTCFPVSFLGPP